MNGVSRLVNGVKNNVRCFRPASSWYRTSTFCTRSFCPASLIIFLQKIIVQKSEKMEGVGSLPRNRK